jgi:hypothetical protein
MKQFATTLAVIVRLVRTLAYRGGRSSTPRPVSIIADFPAYWMPAFAGMTSNI